MPSVKYYNPVSGLWETIFQGPLGTGGGVTPSNFRLTDPAGTVWQLDVTTSGALITTAVGSSGGSVYGLNYGSDTYA